LLIRKVVDKKVQPDAETCDLPGTVRLPKFVLGMAFPIIGCRSLCALFASFRACSRVSWSGTIFPLCKKKTVPGKLSAAVMRRE
jgi:hypothetical protein